jgi:GT2 family glycosyltransferase
MEPSLRFTVVVPSYNRPDRLRRCLAALASLDYPKDRYSVIVVDDGSPEPLEPIVLEATASMSARCVRQPNQGPGAARNHGLQLAEGDWVAFTDDDCRPEPDWLTKLAKAAGISPQAAVGGRVVNALTANIFAESSQLLVDYLYDYYRDRPAAPAFFTSNNLAFPAGRLRDIGGFDRSFPLAAGEDRELCDRWRRLGGELLYVPEAVVWHEHHLRARTFFRQHLNYGRGAYQFHQLRAQSQGGEIKVEPWTFYRDLLLYPMRRHPGLRGASASLLMLLSQVANVGGYFLERTRRAN